MKTAKRSTMFFLLLLTMVCGQYVVPAWGQVLVLKDGTSLVCKKIKVKKGIVEIKSANGVQEFNADMVEGMYDDGKPFQYLRSFPYSENEEMTLLTIGKLGSDEYEFLERIVEGEINLYTREVRGRTQGFGTPSTMSNIVYELIAEKDGTFAVIHDSSWPSGFSKIKKLMVASPVRARLDSGVYKKNRKGMIQATTDYNVSRYQKTSEPMAAKACVSYLYMTAFKYKGSLDVVQDDSLQLTAMWNRALPLNLPAFQTAKVCVSSTKVKACMLLRCIPNVAQYFRIDYDHKDQEITLEKSNTQDAKYYLGKTY